MAARLGTDSGLQHRALRTFIDIKAYCSGLAGKQIDRVETEMEDG
jgi:hypothetical protein